jgi:hypothetical protein
MHPGSESEHSGLSHRLASSATRRTFMKRVIGGLAIAVPAYRVLAGAAPAEAATASGSATPNTCKGGCPELLSLAMVCGIIDGEHWPLRPSGKLSLEGLDMVRRSSYDL